MDGMKRCSSCHEWLPFSMYHRNRASKDGHTHRCKNCCSKARVVLEYCESLNANVKGRDKEVTYMELIASERRHEDPTYDRVIASLKWWIRHKYITQKQAMAIFVHAVDCLTWTDIERLSGVSRALVRFHYEAGIRNLRKRYAHLMMEVG